MDEIANLEAANRALRQRIARLEIALTPFARQPLSSEPEFGRTRPFSLAVHDDQIRLARDALGMLDPMDELARINQEMGLYDE